MRLFSMAVAIGRHHGFKPFSGSHKCRLQSCTYLDCNLLHPCQTNIAQALRNAIPPTSFHRSLSTPCLSNVVDHDSDTGIGKPRIDILGGSRAARVRALVVEVAMALASGMEPVPISTGLGDACFLHDPTGDAIAVIKPIDHHPLGALHATRINGFRGLTLGGLGHPRSVPVGEAGFRELAAYLLDHRGFAGVPPTALVKLSHLPFYVNHSTPPYKLASLQRFVPHDFDAGELGSSGFSVASVHRIGILDVRLLNLDRHAGNILVKKTVCRGSHAVEAAELVPIDHGLCLPEWLDDPYFEWLHWPQALVPFQETEMEYIASLDPFSDAKILRSEVPSLKESSIRLLILCTIFLKRAVAAGLCLSSIGEMMTRGFYGGQENSTSALEVLCMKGKANAVGASVNNTDKGDLRKSMDAESDDISNKIDRHPMILQTPRPPKCPSSPNVKCFPGLNDVMPCCLFEDDGNHKDASGGTELSKGDNGSEDDGLMRSASFSGEKISYEAEGVSFGDMSETEWESFLRNFEKLLPEVLDGTQCNEAKTWRNCTYKSIDSLLTCDY